MPRRRAWLLALLLFCGIALPAFAQTGAGRTPLARLIEYLVPGLQVEGLRGPLAARPGFARATLDDPQGVWLELHEVSLDWSLRALLRREAHISDFTAARVVIHRLPETDTPQPETRTGPLIPELPRLPVTLRLDRFEVARIELGEPVLGQATALRAAGNARLDDDGLDLTLDAATLEPGAALDLQATLRPATGRLAARAVLRGEPGGPLSVAAGLGARPLALDLTLDGPAEGAAFTLTAGAGPGVAANLAGTLAAADVAQLGIVAEGEVDASGLAGAPMGPVAVALDAAQQPDGLVALRRLRLEGAPGVVDASGQLDTEGARTALALDVRLGESGQLGTLVPDLAGWSALSIQGELAGALESPAVALQIAPEGFRSTQGQVAALLGPAPRFTLRAEGDQIETLSLQGQAVRAEISGRAGATLDLAFAAAIDAAPGLVPEVEGALALDGTVTGRREDPNVTLTVRSDRLEAAGRVLEALALDARIVTPVTSPDIAVQGTARVEDLPLSLAVRAVPEDAGWVRLEAAEFSLGPTRIAATGRVRPEDLAAEGEAWIDAPDLAPLGRLAGQEIAGAVSARAQGRATETLDVVFSADLAIPPGGLPEVTGNFALRGTATGLRDDPTLALEARSDRLETAGRVLESLALTARIATPFTTPDIVAEARARLDELPLALDLRAVPEDAGWVRLEAAELSLGPTRIAATGRIRPEDLAAEGEAWIDAPDLAPLGRLAGQEVAGAIAARVQGRAAETLDVAFSADLALPPGVVPEVAGTFALRGTATGPREDPTLALDARSDRLEAAGRVLEALALSARIATPFTTPDIAAQGTARLEGLPLALELRALPEDAGWVRLDAANLSLGPARLAAAGRIRPEDLAAEGEARLDAPDLAPLGPLLGQEIAGSVSARVEGRASETLDLAFAADLAIPEGVVPELAGSFALSGTATGPRADPTVTLDARTDRLEAAGRVLEALSLNARIASLATNPEVAARATGRLENLPLALDLRGAPEAGGWLRLEAAEASLGPARLTAAGRLHPTERLADGQARLAVPDLAPLSPLAGQPLAGALTLEARGAPVNGVQALEARLQAPRLDAAGVEARRLSATASGSLAALDLALSGQVNEVDAEARGRLVEANGARRLDLAVLRATAFGETVRLAAPTRLTLRPDGGVEVAPTTLALPRAGTLRAEGVWGPERADLRAALAGLNLAAFAGFAPDLAPVGTVTGEARVTGPVAAPEVVATLRGSGLGTGAAPGLPSGTLQLDLRREAAGLLTANAQAQFGPQNRLVASARFPEGPGAEAPFDGTLEGNLDLAALTAPLLAAGADRVTGQLTLGLRANGTLADPVLGGEAQLAGASYRNAPLGIAVFAIGGALRPDGRLLRADLIGRTPGGGRLALAGSIEPFTRFLPLDLVLTAQGAQPVRSDLLRATLDAQLRLAGLLGEAATLSGPITVRRADIGIPERLGGGVRTLGPVIEVGVPPGGPRPRQRAQDVPPPRETAGPPIALDITVNAPGAVFVRGRGLEAELGGDLAIGGRIAAPEITGELELRRGELAVIGRTLAFQQGRLVWTGALLPDLGLRATSQAGAYTVQVEVTGPPTAPEIVFSSVPELPQDEVLARLLFDRPVANLSPFEIAQIAAAVAGQAGVLGEGTGILDRLRQGLGLDRLAVGAEQQRTAVTTPEDEQQRRGPTLEAGRYVADGVYVGVRQGTDAGTSRVGVRVDLTPRLRLEAETGDREAGNRVGVGWEWQWGR